MPFDLLHGLAIFVSMEEVKPAQDQEEYIVRKLLKQRWKLMKHVYALQEQAVAIEARLTRMGIAIKDSPAGTSWVRVKKEVK